MLVKPQTFHKAGRYPTAAARAAYLERDGRAVESGALNVNDPDRWAAEMDRTTAAHRLRGDVVGREYVLSPSPDDLATPAQVLEFALEWAARCFPGCEAAVVVHEDSKERLSRGLDPIPHAHVYVSAVDLEAGRKVAMTNEKVREVHDVAQEMSRERGWSAQESYLDPETGRARRLESRRSAFERRPIWERSARLGREAEAERAHGSPARAEAIERRASEALEFERSEAAAKGATLGERRAALEGRPWEKTEVRRRVKEAALAAGGGRGAGFASELADRGVVARRAAGGEVKYGMKGGSLEFRGPTLGRAFSKAALSAGIQISREALESGTSLER